MRRLPLALAATALAAAPLLAAAPAAAATTTTDPAKAAAGWLTTQLVGGDHLESSFTYNGKTTTYADYGNTADAVLGMDAAGVAQDAAARATSYLAAHVGDYAGTAPNYYPGSLAKLALVAEAQHLDPHSFGGVDLVKALQGEEAQAGPNKGLYDDPDATNGYESVVTQALAVVALSRTPADKPSQAAVDWLVGQACGDGGFQTDVRDTTAGACTSEVDATAFAAQALVAAGRDATGALGWLAGHRNSDGGYGQPDSNANSTAVAVQALAAGGRDAASGLGWLRAHQQGCSAPAAQRGAVRYKGTYDTATATRATTQAAQALAGKPLTTIDNAGAAAAAPALYCVAAASTPTPTASPMAAAPTDAPTAPATGTGAGTTTAELPRTGAPSHTGGLAALGAALVAAGGALLGLGRRRRA